MVCLITVLKGNVKVFVWIQEKVGEYSTDVYNITNLTLNVRKRSVLFSFTVFCVGMSFFAEIFYVDCTKSMYSHHPWHCLLYPLHVLRCTNYPWVDCAKLRSEVCTTKFKAVPICTLRIYVCFTIISNDYFRREHLTPEQIQEQEVLHTVLRSVLSIQQYCMPLYYRK